MALGHAMRRVHFRSRPFMYRHIRPYLSRHEPRGHFHLHVKSTLGAMLGVLVVGGLAAWTAQPLLLAPLGATALVLFGQPRLPGSQPVNVFMGYLVGAVVTTLIETTAPGLWWAAGLGVGATMLVMLGLRITHAPAAGMPLLMLSSHLPVMTMFAVTLVGCIVLVVLAMLWHRLPPRQAFPLRRIGSDQAKHPVLELAQGE